MRSRTLALLAAGLGWLAAPGGASGDEAPLRLAATLLQPGDAAALVDLDGAQAWLRPGERVGRCRLELVEDSSAALDCGAGPLVLRLAAGAPGDVQALMAVEQVILPPGTLQSLADRPQAVVRGIDLRPEVFGDSLVGWRITRLDAHGPAAVLGLRESDLVVDVGGVPANAPVSFVATLRTLPSQGAFTLDVVREGRPLRLQVIAPKD